MYTFEIKARVFGGLALEIEADNEGIVDAKFASTGNDLPDSMYRKLVKCSYDMDTINDEIAMARYEDA